MFPTILTYTQDEKINSEMSDNLSEVTQPVSGSALIVSQIYLTQHL